MDARNSFGGALVFGAWKGRNTVRQLVTPANPQTTNQVAARNRVRVTANAQKQVNTSTQIRSGQTLSDKALLAAKAPAGYAWNGFLTDQMIGTGSTIYTAAAAAWTALTAGEKTAWETAAGARVPAFFAAAQGTAGGGAGTAITRGQVYFMQQYGMYAAGIFTTAPNGTPPTYA